MSEMHKWESLDQMGNLERIVVPGGWLYVVCKDVSMEHDVDCQLGVSFVPTPSSPPRLVRLETYRPAQVFRGTEGPTRRPGEVKGSVYVQPSAVVQMTQQSEPRPEINEAGDGYKSEPCDATLVELAGLRDDDGASPFLVVKGTPEEVARALGLDVEEANRE